MRPGTKVLLSGLGEAWVLPTSAEDRALGLVTVLAQDTSGLVPWTVPESKVAPVERVRRGSCHHHVRPEGKR